MHFQYCLQGHHGDFYGRLNRLSLQDAVIAELLVGLGSNVYDHAGLLYDIGGIFIRENTNVLSIQMLSNNKNNTVILKRVIQVMTLSRLLVAMVSVKQLPNVVSVKKLRCSDGRKTDHIGLLMQQTA